MKRAPNALERAGEDACHVRESICGCGGGCERDSEWKRGKGRKRERVGSVFVCVSAANVFSSSSSPFFVVAVAASTIFLVFLFGLAFRSCSMLIFTIHCYIHNIFHYFSRSQRFSFAIALFFLHHATQKLIAIIYGNFVCSLNELHFFAFLVTHTLHGCRCCCCCCRSGCCTS